MLPKLSSRSAAFCVMSLILCGPVASGAQTDPTANPTATEQDAVVPTFEFRNVAPPAAPETLPDSSSVARTRGDSLHGQAYAFWGSGLGSVPGVPLLTQFPLSQFGASLGGDLGHTSWFVAFDQYGMDTQRLLAVVAAAQARSARLLLPVNASVLSVSSFEARADRRFSRMTPLMPA